MVSGFGGEIRTTYENSTPEWQQDNYAQGKPNVLLILLDDTGFANLGCYGSNIDTPNMDALAKNGLRYNNFHVTPLCSPTRASILTGRNHHAVGISTISGFGDSGYPNQRGCVSRHSANLAEMLGEEGFATFALGKWHLNPSANFSAGGPHNEWPLQRGFDRFYGFLPGGTPQFYPELTYDNHPVNPPKSPQDGYHVTNDLVDHAIEFINDLNYSNSERPFFMYFAPGAMHAPHQVPGNYVEKYKGFYDEGWDIVRERYFKRQIEMGIIPENTVLPPRNPGVKPWSSLTKNQQKFVCRLQETWAGFLNHTDDQIGRLIDHLDLLQKLDDTVVVLTADNGTSQAGGPYGVMSVGTAPGRGATNDGVTIAEKRGRPLPEEDFDLVQERLDEIGTYKTNSDIPWGWAQVGNTPLRWYKQDTHGGGVRVPMIVHYPSGIEETGGIRNQFHYVNDITPTILELLGVIPKENYNGFEQMPITGTSLVYSLHDANCSSEKPIQYFEMMGKRGLWLDGWKAVTRHQSGDAYNEDQWELYHLDEDFSESRNLASEEPSRLREMIDLWWLEAGRNGVLPLDDRVGQRGRRLEKPRTSYRFIPPMAHVPRVRSPSLADGNWLLKADVEISSAETEGVIFAQGSFLNGISLYVQNGFLAFVYTVMDTPNTWISKDLLPLGRVTLDLLFQKQNPNSGVFLLKVQNKEIASIVISDTTHMASMRGADVGRDLDAPVTDLYIAPFNFTGIIHSVLIKLEL
ncbi:MAG: arylsulfatase [Gammaproteobacteria bacterium TMED1]|nr:MAG: arylsulfatase [Gammaproteobacteria bacterium TMED1]|tara:strand:+ start:8123 stop:10357 length:2235 start_codon:yes stop_codon:yes gene_type:complete